MTGCPDTTLSQHIGIKLYGESLEISQPRNVLFPFLITSVEAIWSVDLGQPEERKLVDEVQCHCHEPSISLDPNMHHFFDKFVLGPSNFPSTLISY